jgi:tRNA A-37 threonylcarbamoyl transferase component Bud32
MSRSSQDRDLIERLLEEFLERLRRGESPTIEEYERRFPHGSEQIAPMFRMALAMEEAAQESPLSSGTQAWTWAAPVPTKIGRFEVIDRIGVGGMGVVYKARDPSVDRVVALKLLRPELAADARARQRFLREARAAAAIKSEHVVGIYEVTEFQHDERAAWQPLIVMEYIKGKSLKQRLAREPLLDVRQILRIATQIAWGLAAAHQQGIVHRDIKPANILLENGVERVKITDFGLAVRTQPGLGKQDPPAARLTESRELLGTFEYMSPEQTRNQTLDHRSDLFSLGGVLYEICTGESPFAGDGDMVETIRRIRSEPPRPIRQVNPGVPVWLVALIDRLLEKEPRQRPCDATEVAKELTDYLANVQEGRPIPAPKTAARRRVVLLGGGLCLLAVVLAVLPTPWRASFARRLPVPAMLAQAESETSIARTDQLDLDMATAREIVERHGGKITNEAVEFLQSTFAEVDDELGRAIRRLDFLHALAFLDSNLVRLDGLGEVTTYDILWLNHCPYLTSLQGLKKSRFQRVQISDCDGLLTVAGIGELASLEVLELRVCDSLTDVSEVQRLRELRQLYVEGCPGIEDFDWLRGLVGLHTLYINDCSNLRHTDDFSELLALEELDLSKCANLADIRGLQGLVRLRFVNLTGCASLAVEDIAALRLALPNAKIMSAD